MKVTDLQINTRKEGTDDLMVTLSVSTLVMASAPAKPGAEVAR